MITPFGLRHTFLVRDLAASCTVLDPAAPGDSSSANPLHQAMRGYFVRQSGTFTYVLHAVDGGVPWQGFVQARGEPGANAWRVVCLAPKIQDQPHAPTLWYRLLLHLCIAAGEHHIQKLFACVEPDGAEEQVLRQASFAVYCHDSVWLQSGNRPLQCTVAERVRAARAQDQWDIQRLYARVAPRLVREAEGSGENGTGRGPPGLLEAEAEFVLTGRQDEVTGWAAVSSAGSAYWLRLMLSPDEREGEAELVRCALAGIPEKSDRKVLCAVRDYEGGVATVLGQCGFELLVERSLLVKHTTVQVSETRRRVVPSLEKRAGAVPTASQSQAARAVLERVR